MHRYLAQFTEDAFRDFTEFRGDDTAKLLALRARWHARKEFQEEIEVTLTNLADAQEIIKDEYASRGHDAEELESLRSITADE